MKDKTFDDESAEENIIDYIDDIDDIDDIEEDTADSDEQYEDTEEFSEDDESEGNKLKKIWQNLKKSEKVLRIAVLVLGAAVLIEYLSLALYAVKNKIDGDETETETVAVAETSETEEEAEVVTEEPLSTTNTDNYVSEVTTGEAVYSADETATSSNNASVATATSATSR